MCMCLCNLHMYIYIKTLTHPPTHPPQMQHLKEYTYSYRKCSNTLQQHSATHLHEDVHDIACS